MNFYLQGNDGKQIHLEPGIVQKLQLIDSFTEVSKDIGIHIFPVDLFSSITLRKMVTFLMDETTLHGYEMDLIAEILLALDFFQADDRYLNLVAQYLGQTYPEQFRQFRTHLGHLQPIEPGNPGKYP